MLAELLEPLVEGAHRTQDVRANHDRGEQREDPHDGPDLDRYLLAVSVLEDVVVEAVVGVPEPLGAHGVDDQDEVLDELDLQVHPGLVLGCQHAGHLQQGQCVEGHPVGAIGLLQPTAGWQVRPVDGADVVQAEEPAREDVVALRVHPVDPPGEVQQQLGQQPGQERPVATAVDVPHVQSGPRMHGRVDVAEVPLVGRQRTVGMLEPLPAHHQQLVLGEGGVDMGQRDGVEAQVPRGEPRVLPRVGHGQDVLCIHVRPPSIAAGPTLSRRGWLRRIAVQPAPDVVGVELLAPDHPGKGLPGHEPFILRGRAGDDLPVEVVSFAEAVGQNLVEVVAEGRLGGGLAQPHAHHLGGSRVDSQQVPRRALAPGPIRVDRGGAGHHMVVDAVLGEGRGVGGAEHALGVGLVVAEQQLGR